MLRTYQVVLLSSSTVGFDFNYELISCVADAKVFVRFQSIQGSHVPAKPLESPAK